MAAVRAPVVTDAPARGRQKSPRGGPRRLGPNAPRLPPTREPHPV